MEVEFIWKEHFDDKMCNVRIKGNKQQETITAQVNYIITSVSEHTERDWQVNSCHQLVNFLCKSDAQYAILVFLNC